MKALVVFAHPVADSFAAALHQTVLSTLQQKGCQVDDCDLYAEGFDPVLSADERRNYHDLDINAEPVASYVERLRAADTLILICPIWNMGFPAILKGFFDRVFLPGVSFKMAGGQVTGNLGNITRLIAITTYGGSRWRVWLGGDPPRRVVMRSLRSMMNHRADATYLALYDMNRIDAAARQAFLARVTRRLREL